MSETALPSATTGPVGVPASGSPEEAAGVARTTGGTSVSQAAGAGKVPAIATASDLLAAHAFFSGISHDHLERLSCWSRRTVFHSGTRVFNEGGKADRFWLIREGEVRLDTALVGGDRVVVDTVGANSVLGWSWIFPPYRWRFGATAVSSVLAMEFDASGVRRLCDSRPALGYDLTRRFMSVVIDRMHSTRLRLLDAHDRTRPVVGEDATDAAAR